MTASNAGISERLRTLRDFWKITQDTMAERMGVVPRSYKNYEYNDRGPKASDLAGLGAYGVNLNWLLTGAGEMFENNASASAAAIDGDLMGLVLEAVKAIYKAENARICDRDAGKLAAQIYAEALPLTGGSTDLEDRKAAIRLATVKLRNSLAAAAEPLDNKRLA